jgi:hypothetical protein
MINLFERAEMGVGRFDFVKNKEVSRTLKTMDRVDLNDDPGVLGQVNISLEIRVQDESETLPFA